MRILAIGAHPDDVEIGAGGLLLKMARSNNEVYIYVLTFGEAGGTETATREMEARASAMSIGAREIQFGGFKDTRLLPNGKLVNSIERMVNFLVERLYAHKDEFDREEVSRLGLKAFYPEHWYPAGRGQMWDMVHGGRG
jgi:LmbE family N-acetylglucosaminyl deacetylase